MIIITIIGIMSWWLLWLVAPHVTGGKRTVLMFLLGVLVAYSYYEMHRAIYQRGRRMGRIQCVIPLRVGPDGAYGSCGMLKPGESVVLTCVEGDWYRVEAQRCTGWVPRTAVEIVT